MTLDDVRCIFNRALMKAFDRTKWLLTFTVLALCGVMTVFFRGVAVNATQWLVLSMTFLPIFLCAGILLSLGILLIRIYHDEVKEKRVSYKKTLSNSWE